MLCRLKSASWSYWFAWEVLTVVWPIDQAVVELEVLHVLSLSLSLSAYLHVFFLWEIQKLKIVLIF